MQIKPYQKEINIFEHEDVFSIFTNYRKSHFISEAKLYDALDSMIKTINVNYTIHLSTYPYVAIHVSFGRINGLHNDKDKIKNMVVDAIYENFKKS